jgi:hypothetical protein
VALNNGQAEARFRGVILAAVGPGEGVEDLGAQAVGDADAPVSDFDALSLGVRDGADGDLRGLPPAGCS